MKKQLYLSLIIVLWSLSAMSQVQLTQYFMENTLYNTAFTGSQEAICANIIGRQQWMGLQDTEGNSLAPTSIIFNVHSPIYSINSGLGMNFIYDKVEFEKNVGIKLNYAYHKTFNNELQSLGIGIGASFLNKTVDFMKYAVEQPADPLLQTKQSESGILTDFDIGIQYTNKNKMYVGISVNNLLQTATEIGNVFYTQNRHLYATAGYYIKVIEERKQLLYVIPSLLIKSNFVNMQIDVSARAEYNNMMAGLTYRYQDAVSVFAGINMKGYRVGVSYDLTTGSLSKASYGSAEIFVGYCFPVHPKVKMSSLYNTRYL